jgi:hypothetical protein
MSESTTWTEQDDALWRSCGIAAELFVHRRLPDPVPVTFALQFAGAEERILAWGRFERAWFGAIGDGTYRSSTTFVGGFGPLGLALGAATLTGSALGTSSRKARARRDATERWRPLDQGNLFVSTHGIYLDTGQEFLPFIHECILRADLTAPATLELTCTMADGTQQSYIITSWWAELVFLLWATRCSPHHPKLTNLAWLPRSFIDRLLASGLWERSPVLPLVDAPLKLVRSP